MKKKVFVVCGDRAVAHLFTQNGFEICYSVKGADIICFTGGADVNPQLYDAELHQHTYFDVSRDNYELSIFQEAFKLSLPMIGICRGGQLLNVLNGGTMYQDVTNHTTSHLIKMVAGYWQNLELWATSTHHQMMRPAMHGKLLAIGPKSEVEYWCSETDSFLIEELDQGIEVVQYGNHICFQPHPEMLMGSQQFDPLRKYFFELIKTIM